jgi:hypothetical protein
MSTRGWKPTGPRRRTSSFPRCPCWPSKCRGCRNPRQESVLRTRNTPILTASLSEGHNLAGGFHTPGDLKVTHLCSA